VLLIVVLLLLVLLAAYGGLALSPLLWILVAVLVIALLVGPGVSGEGWGGGRYRRW
jgi:hypothetical protein